MSQLVTYSSLTRSVGGAGSFIQVREAKLHDLLRSILPSVEVDEVWYRRRYGDVDEAIRLGHVATARDHYVSTGYFEGRFPRPFVVDERWYVTTYPDVAMAIGTGKLKKAQDHFEAEGYKEGRLPYEGWTL